MLWKGTRSDAGSVGGHGAEVLLSVAEETPDAAHKPVAVATVDDIEEAAG